MPWACNRCRTVHTQNPDECRNCGHRIFSPTTAEDVSNRSDGIESPESVSVDRDRVMGSTPDPDYDSSPDVSVDGSVTGRTAATDTVDGSSHRFGPLRGTFAHKLRALLLAPVGLLRRYLLPLLAFLLVFGGVAYLFLVLV